MVMQMAWGGVSCEQEEDDASGLMLTEASEFRTVIDPPRAFEGLKLVGIYMDEDHPGEEGLGTAVDREVGQHEVLSGLGVERW